MLPLADQAEPIIMGILNVTPDSFSDGGLFYNVESAVRRGLIMAQEGAKIIDVGGESTRPGSESVLESEQILRISPVISALKEKLPEDHIISVDTSSARVALAAIEAGAGMINDVWAGRNDERMFQVAAELGLPIAMMHMQGNPKNMQNNPFYEDVVGEVVDFLLERARIAEDQGVLRENIILDPGIGFGKRQEDNLKLISEIDKLVGTGYPVMLGASRKRFMGSLCREKNPLRLLGATVATTVFGVTKGVRIFRVHDITPNKQAADIATALVSA